MDLALVPDSAPPYDCAEHGGTCQALADLPPPNLLGRRLAGTYERAAAEPRTATASVGAVGKAGATRASGDACGGTIWPRQFAQAIVETIAGLRPFRQLTGWCTDQAQARIQALTPLLRTDRPPAIVRVLAAQPTAGIAEVTVIATFGARTRALAMRFEHRPGRPARPGIPARPARWLCTVIEAGLSAVPIIAARAPACDRTTTRDRTYF